MHFGILAATASLDELLVELNRHTGEFVSGEVLQSPYDALDLPDNDGFVLAGGELPGRAFLLDSSYLISDEPDMIIAMSDRLGTVVGVCAETVSGTWALTVARAGDLVRHVFVQHASMTRGMAIGEPLSTEEAHPIEDLDGDGLFAALSLFELDPEAWLSNGPATAIRFTAARMPEGGRAQNIRREHMERYKFPEGDNWLSRLTVVERESDAPAGEATSETR